VNQRETAAPGQTRETNRIEFPIVYRFDPDPSLIAAYRE
jgi:hypothetical protein